MRQHPIDLLPPHIRARTLTGMVVRRYVLAVVFALGLVIVSATYAHIIAERAMHELDAVRIEAEEVLRTEKMARSYREQLAEYESTDARYRQLALPIDISNIVATIASETPASVTLERLNVSVITPRTTHASVTSSDGDTVAQPTRELRVELAGFAVSDADVGMFIERLSAYSFFEHVSLDYSRSRTVRARPVREFRLLLHINFGVQYIVQTAGGAPGELADGHAGGVAGGVAGGP